MQKGYLLLETGEVFPGTLIGSEEEVAGEVVFNTSMTGYQEIMSDPSYAGQIIVFCYPLIGNYGINANDFEAEKIYAKGIITGETCTIPNHYSSEETASELLVSHKISGLTGVDTRELVRTIRKQGTVKGFITNKLKDFPKEVQITNWVESVSTKLLKTHGLTNSGPHIALIDYGYKKSILDSLLFSGCKVTLLPYESTLEEIKGINPDGVVLSNGPGDPEVLVHLLPNIKQIAQSFPTLGICLGHQLLALSFGARTEKLTFGHRGGNHPVKELATGKVFITSQNHSYVVAEQSIEDIPFTLTYKNINDGTVEGMVHTYLPIMSVQFHPEAHPGPHDTNYIFNQYLDLIRENTGVMPYAINS
jgi:carbamoyl-phosphate synthase small subunit